MRRRSKAGRLRALVEEAKGLVQEREVQTAMARWSGEEWHAWTNALNTTAALRGLLVGCSARTSDRRGASTRAGVRKDDPLGAKCCCSINVLVLVTYKVGRQRRNDAP